MKLVYLAPIGLFDDWAHTVQIMKMCEAFSENGISVELIVPNRKNKNNVDPFKYNHTKNIFKITKVPFLDLFFTNPHPIFYWLRLSSFFVTSRIYLYFKNYDILYTREIYASLLFSNVYTELHSFPKKINKLKIKALKKSKGIVVLTSTIKSKISNLGIKDEKIIVCHDGVRIDEFTNLTSKSEAREKLGINREDYIFGYIGTLKTMGMEKGVGTAIDSLKFLPQNYKLYVVGGEVHDVDFYKKFAKDNGLEDRVIFTGRVLHESVPNHIAVCDVVVAPFPKNDHYEYYMSPLKIFEYMASKRPIIATDLTSLREVLVNKKTAILIPPSDPESLALSIKELVSNKSLANEITSNAYGEVVNKYTWKKRADNILNFIKK